MNIPLMSLVLQFYILTIPFTNVFAFTPTLLLPLIVSAGIFGLLMMQGGVSLRKHDAALFLMFIFGCIGTIFSLDFVGDKNVNHVVAMSVSILLYFITVRTILLRVGTISTVSKALSLSLLISSIFIMTEFGLRNLYGIDVHDWLPGIYEDRNLDATVFIFYHRARGFATEPAIMGIFYELALPMSFIYLRTRGWLLNIIFYSINFIAFGLLFTSAGIVAVIAAAIASLLAFNTRERKWAVGVGALLVMVFASTFVYEPAQMYRDDVVLSKASELMGDSGPATRLTSGEDRRQRYEAMVELCKASPLGIGWGTVSQLSNDHRTYYGIGVPSGLTSLYGEVLVAGGVFGVLCFIVFIFGKLRSLKRSKSPSAPYVFAALVGMLIHYFFVSDYYFPMLWFAFAFTDFIREEQEDFDGLVESDRLLSASPSRSVS